VANARISGQNAYRGWLTGQQGQALGAMQTANQQRISNYGTMFGGMNQNAQAWSNYQLGKNQQGFGTNFAEGFGSSLGKTAGGGNGSISIGG
jgi:hypothetical protein